MLHIESFTQLWPQIKNDPFHIPYQNSEIKSKKVLISDFQSQFSMTKINWVFTKHFSLKIEGHIFCYWHFLKTSAGAYPQLSTQPKFFWSFSNLYSKLLWSFWVVFQIWIRGNKVQFITESCVFKAETPANFPF